MGQKVNPKGFRVGVIRDWDARWYAKKGFQDYLLEDYKVRKYIKEKLYASGVSRIELERAANRLRVNIHTAKPGIVIGRGGAEVEVLRKELENMTKFFFALLENCGILVLSIGGDHHVATRSDASSVIYTHTDSPGGGGESPPVPAGRQLPRQRLHRLGPSAPGL